MSTSDASHPLPVRRPRRWRRLALGAVVVLAPTSAVAAATGTSVVAAPATCSTYTERSDLPLQRCDRGLLVASLQQRLAAAGSEAIVTDGYFGPATEQAVREFQERSGLPVDGIVGPETWARLEEATGAATTTTTASLEIRPPADPIAELPPFVTGPIAAASVDGVDVRFADGDTVRISDDPAATAALVGDDVVFQRQSTETADEPGPTVFRWVRATEEIEPLELANPTGGSITVHDVAAVDGALTVLYETGPPDCDAGNDCDSALVAQDVATGESTEIDRMNTFEAGWSGLTLADNGWIVGTRFESITTSLYTNSIGSEPAPGPEAVGLEAGYDDCAACPVAYSIDPAATAISWIVRLDDGTPAMVTSAFDGTPFRVEFADPPESTCALDATFAVGDDDGPTSGFFVTGPCPGGEPTAAIAVEVTDDFVGATTPMPAGVIYDLGR